MADENRGGEVAASDGMRASHQDRDRVVEVLRVAAGDGRLTPDELDERVERALSARTYAELAVLTTDLPVAGSQGMTAPKPKDVMRIQCGSGHASRDGRWVVPQRLDIDVRSGHVVLDFTEAVITQPELSITAQIRSGHLRVITKPGIVVDTDDVTVRNGHIKVRTPWAPDTPVLLRVNVSGKIGSGHFIARPPRRTFWQWLRRAPLPHAIAAS